MNSETFSSDFISDNSTDPRAYSAAQCDNIPYPNTTEPEDVAPAVGKGQHGRSKNFSDDEDEVLVSAWLNVTLDPINGVDQSRKAYWTRIHEYFHANKKFESDRTAISLMNRWSGIQHDVNLFAGCLSRIEQKNHSGWSVDDKIAAASKLFKEEDKKKRSFTYLHCWKILKDKPKWMDRNKNVGTKNHVGKKQKTTANSSPSSTQALVATGDANESQPTGNGQERPPGKKKEKQKLRQGSAIEAVDYLMAKKKEADAEKEVKKEERSNKSFALQQERIRIEKEKFEFKRKLEEERIMNVDMSTIRTFEFKRKV